METFEERIDRQVKQARQRAEEARKTRVLTYEEAVRMAEGIKRVEALFTPLGFMGPGDSKGRCELMIATPEEAAEWYAANR